MALPDVVHPGMGQGAIMMMIMSGISIAEAGHMSGSVIRKVVLVQQGVRA